MTDLEIIDSFKQQISWGDETSLLQHDTCTFLDAGICIYVPVHWSNFCTKKLLAKSDVLGRRVVALVWGNPSEKVAIELCDRCCIEGLSCQFIDVAGRLAHSYWITRSLDGVDWNRSLMRIASQGLDAKPVFEWEES